MGPREALFPNYAPYPIRLVRGEGSHVWDAAGQMYIDVMSGVAVTALGHAPAPVTEALVTQLHTLWHVSNWFEIPQQERFAQTVTARCCGDHVFYCNSGAEANEAAIKLARRYHRKIKGNDKYKIITFTQSFHGRTMATLSATGQEKVKEGFDPLLPGFVHVPYNDIDALEAAVDAQTCAIFLEFVQGEGGVTVAEETFVAAIQRLCAQYDMLLIADEIQSGVGRTGRWFAYEHYGIEPDIITMAKGIASGFPMGMMVGKAKLKDAFSAGAHGSTFGGTPLACVAAQATWETIEREQLLLRAHALGQWAIQHMQQSLQHVEEVVAVRGRGLMVGIELTFPAAHVVTACHRHGVLCITAGMHVLRLLPALNIPESLWRQAVDIIIEQIQHVRATQPTKNTV